MPFTKGDPAATEGRILPLLEVDLSIPFGPPSVMTSIHADDHIHHMGQGMVGETEHRDRH